MHARRQELGAQPGKQAAQQQWRLEAPYLRVPRRMPLGVLAKYVALRLHAPERARVNLFCRGALLRPAETVRSLFFLFSFFLFFVCGARNKGALRGLVAASFGRPCA
jgi:hypothetical protein